MAFFDDFAAKTKSLANRVSDKNRDNSELRRMEKEKKQIQQELETTFIELGKYFYDHKEDMFPEDYENIIQHIDQLKGLIADKESRIIAVKDKISCPYCGRMMPKEAVICPACGKKITPEDKAIDAPAIEMDQEIVYCPVCGAENEAVASVCKECGTPLQMHDSMDDYEEPAVEEFEEVPAEEAIPAEDVPQIQPEEAIIAEEIDETLHKVADEIEAESKEAAEFIEE